MVLIFLDTATYKLRVIPRFLAAVLAIPVLFGSHQGQVPSIWASESTFQEQLSRQYGDIGARLSLRRDPSGASWLTVEEALFSGPAYEAGLRSGDRIVEVQEKPTRNEPGWKIYQRLRGKPETQVSIKVTRRGWPEAKLFTLTRKQVRRKTTHYLLLPGGIGYLRLDDFGLPSAPEVKDVLEGSPNLKALVIDLRGNWGGFLRSGQKIAGYFLDPGKLLMTRRRRGAESERVQTEGKKLTDVPMVILVNGGTAGTAEMVAGALQFHERAVIVGQRTFGKGSTQDIKYLRANDEKSGIVYTHDKWYLPDGRPLEAELPGKGGIIPNTEIVLAEREYWRDVETERLRKASSISVYLDKQWTKELFGALAESDGRDDSRYPQFEELHSSLKTKLSKSDLRILVRQQIRRRVEEKRGRLFILDLQIDVLLQRGILAACKAGEIDAARIKEYNLFSRGPDRK